VRLLYGPYRGVGLSAGAGVARQATHFSLLRQRKVSKRKATLVPASLRCATGNLRCSVQPGSKTTRLRLKQVFALIRLNLRSSAHPQGVGDRNTNSEIPNTKQPKTEKRIPEETSTRHGVSLSVLVPAPDCPLWMRRGAQAQADQGSRLSEPKASSSETPPEPSTAGCPVAQRRGRRNQGRLFFGDFGVRVTSLREVSEPRAQSAPFGEQKKTRFAGFAKVTCRRATPGQLPSANIPAVRTNVTFVTASVGATP
jgi:hypothetical protein